MNQKSSVSNIDLGGLTIEELSTLIHKAQSALQKKEQARVKELRDQARALAKQQGISVQELLGIEKLAPAPKRGIKKRRVKIKRRGNKGPVPPKYRNPDNTKETWTGRGQMPRWMRAKVEKGAKKDDFLI